MLKKFVFPVLFHMAFSACMFFGFSENIEGAQYIAKFYIWAFMLPVSILLLIGISSPEYVKKKHINGPANAIMKKINLFMNFVYLLTFVFYGHVVTAVALMVSMIMVGIYHVKYDSI